MKPYTNGTAHNISVPGNGISKYGLNLSRIYNEVIDFERTNPLPRLP